MAAPFAILWACFCPGSRWLALQNQGFQPVLMAKKTYTNTDTESVVSRCKWSLSACWWFKKKNVATTKNVAHTFGEFWTFIADILLAVLNNKYRNLVVWVHLWREAKCIIVTQPPQTIVYTDQYFAQSVKAKISFSWTGAGSAHCCLSQRDILNKNPGGPRTANRPRWLA